MRFSLLVGVFCVWGRFLCPWFSAILVHGAPAWPHLLSSRGLLRPEPPAPGEHQGPSAGGGGAVLAPALRCDPASSHKSGRYSLSTAGLGGPLCRPKNPVLDL